MKFNEQNVVGQNLMGMSHQDLEQFFSVIDEKSYRATQLMKWTHQQGRYRLCLDDQPWKIITRVVGKQYGSTFT